jgi:hypothetical protein
METEATTSVEIVSLSAKSLMNEIRELGLVRDTMKRLKENFESVSLARDIRHLQEASRIQNIKPELRDMLLKELQRRKIIKQVIDGDFS